MQLTYTMPTNATEQDMLVLLMNLPFFQSVSVSGSTLTVTFEQESSGVDEIIQARLIQWGNEIRLFDYLPDTCDLPRTEPPFEIDFRSGLKPGIWLHKNVTSIDKGDILEEVFYGSLDLSTQTYQTPIMRRTYVITYHPEAMWIHSDETLEYYRRDGSLHPDSKPLPHDYIQQKYWEWWKNKRGQVISWLTHNVAMAMAANLMPQGWTLEQIVTEGHAFYDEYTVQISAYVSGGGTALDAAITADTRTWIDLPWPWNPAMSIRQKFLEQIAP